MSAILAIVDPVETGSLHYLPAVLPVVVLVLGAVFIVLMRSIARGEAWVAPVSMFTGIAAGFGAAASLILQWQATAPSKGGSYVAFSGTVVVDRFGVFLSVLVCVALVLVLLLSSGFLLRPGVAACEYMALMLLSAAGMIAMTSANDLLVVFVALELLSIPLYVLAAFDRRRRESQEAGLKYFVLGALASAIFLYGAALVYGTAGSTRIVSPSGVSIATFFVDPLGNAPALFLIGALLVIVGFAFKVAAAPFHMWTPDVYQGAPTPVTAFMASATKVAGFAVLLRLVMIAFQTSASSWQPVIWVLAALSLVVGSVAALVQTDIKRILAYSSIANAGYILIGVGTDTQQGVQSALVYLAIYTVMIIGALAVISWVGGTQDAHGLTQYRGLARRNPVLAGFLALFVLAQAGVPFTAGFIAKLGVFSAAVNAKVYWLAILGMLAAAVAAFYYLRIVVQMYMTDDEGEGSTIEMPGSIVRWSLGAVIVVCAGLTLVIGVFPQWLLHLASQAVATFS